MYWIDKFSRCITRTTAIAAAAAYVPAVVIFILYRGPYCSNPSVERTFYSYLIDLVALTSSISIVASLPAIIIFACGKEWKHRTIHWYIALSMMTLLFAVMMPVW
jgi:hypothetical protein